MAPSTLDRLWRGWAALDGEQVRFRSLFFTHYAAFSGFAVFRNVYLEEMGMSGSAMGTIGFVLVATGVLVQPVWGIVTDYWRAERSVLLVGAVVSALALFSYPLADDLAAPFVLVAVGTALFSAFRAPIVPVANGLVLARGYEYGNIRAFGSLAFGIGSLGFGVVVATLGTPSVVYFYALGMAVLVGVVWSLSETPPDADDRPDPTGSQADEDADHADADSGRDTAGNGDGDGPTMWGAVRALVTTPEFLVVLGVAFLVGLSIRSGSAFFSVYMRAVDAAVVVGPWTLPADTLTGAAWAVKTAFEVLAFVYALRLSNSYKLLLVAGAAAVTLPNLVYALTGAPWAVLGVQAAGGLGYGMFYLAIVNLVHAIAADRVTSTAQTVLTGAGIGFGGAVGQIVAGELVDLVGIQRMYFYVAAIGFAGAAVGLFVGDRTVDSEAIT